MADRLSPLDASFLYAELRTTAMHIGAVMTFDPPAGGSFDAAALTEMIGERLHLVPRYRQKVRTVPGGLVLPVWVDDPDFDLHYHVRHSALAAPGTEAVLRALVGRLLVRQLDRSRPLWEVTIVEGCPTGGSPWSPRPATPWWTGWRRWTSGAVLLDLSPRPRATPVQQEWRPQREPSTLGLVAGATGELLRRPRAALELATGIATRAVTDVRRTVVVAGRTVGGVMAAGRRAAASRPVAALNAATGAQRRYGTARTTLADHRTVRGPTAAPSTT